MQITRIHASCRPGPLWQAKHDKSGMSSKSPIEFQQSMCEIEKSLSEIGKSPYEKLKLLYENEKLSCEIRLWIKASFFLICGVFRFFYSVRGSLLCFFFFTVSIVIFGLSSLPSCYLGNEVGKKA